MVDRKDNVETETAASERKVWITPRLETSSIAEDTLHGTGNTNDGGGAGDSIS